MPAVLDQLVYDLDPTLTADDVARAGDVNPTPYSLLDEHHNTPLVGIGGGLVTGQDDLTEVGSGLVIPATPAQAIDHAHGMSVGDCYVGIGYCLRTVRQDEFRIPPLYLDAETAWEEADLKHPTSDPAAIPRGAVPFWTNGRYGHVALSAGGGMCWTTDYRRPGYVDLAPIASLASWCGGKLAGWAEDVNGVDLWPDADKPQRFGLDDRIKLVRRALKRARDHKAPRERIDGLATWLKRLEAKSEQRDKGTR